MKKNYFVHRKGHIYLGLNFFYFSFFFHESFDQLIDFYYHEENKNPYKSNRINKKSLILTITIIKQVVKKNDEQFLYIVSSSINFVCINTLHTHRKYDDDQWSRFSNKCWSYKHKTKKKSTWLSLFFFGFSWEFIFHYLFCSMIFHWKNFFFSVSCCCFKFNYNYIFNG